MVLLLAGAVLFGGLFLASRSPEINKEATTSPDDATAVAEVAGIQTTSDVQINDDDPVLGDPNAPLTIVEFSDFECPYCREFHQSVFSTIKQRYIDTGQVKVVFKDFPLTQIHPHALAAAEAAQCANAQGKFWEYADLLFNPTNELTNEALINHARTIGIDESAFTKCVSQATFANTVTEDSQEGIRLGISGTPSFIIGRELYEGALPLNEFDRVIQAAQATPTP